MIASIEGIFNHQLKYYFKTKPKFPWVTPLRKKFNLKLDNNKYIKFETILDEWKKNDPRVKNKISKLKEYLLYRHWLAHGRHWSIHYWNIPDPNEIYILYTELNKLILFNFDLS